MQVVVLKSYEKRFDVSYNYGDDYEAVYHNFNALEKVMELSNDEYNELLRAISYFNSKKNSPYVLKAVVVMEDNEVNDLLSDFRVYEKKEVDKAAKAEEARKLKMEEDRLKREKAKADRALKKLAKELNLSVEDVRNKLAN